MYLRLFYINFFGLQSMSIVGSPKNLENYKVSLESHFRVFIFQVLGGPSIIQY
jgi:hypothetical protein